jgi:hypothetical protein
LLGWREVAVMSFRILIAVILFNISMDHCAAEQPSVRLDLTAPRLAASFVTIPFVFEDSSLDCPEERRTLTVSNGLLRSYYLSLPPIDPPIFPTKYIFDPIDDSTYRLQFIRANCRFDVDIRQQVRADGEWKSLLVMEERRPSLSAEARQEAVRRRLGDFAKPTNASQVPLSEINKMLRGKGPRRWGGVTVSFGFPFDEAPKSCMEAFGEYRITKNSFAMAFFAPLPGDLNKFVMEGSDLDETHGRIYLTRDDCRFEFTISQSAMHDRQWTALPLRPVPEDKDAKPAESNR